MKKLFKKMASAVLGLALCVGAGSGSALMAAEGGSFMDHTYGVFKLMVSPGASYDHGGHTVTGDLSTGFGFDFGYTINDHMAAELAFSYGMGGITQEVHKTSIPLMASNITGDATYTSLGINGVYIHHLTETLSAVGKLGVISESETLNIDGHSASGSSSGLAYIVAAEYKLGDHKELVFEYEGATVEGPRAFNLFVGYKMGFGGH